MKTHFIYISAILICIVTIGWVETLYSSQILKKNKTIELQKIEIRCLQNSRDHSELIYKSLSTAYPRVPQHKMNQYALTINDLSKRFNLSWSFISAIIRIESNFNPTLTSPKDAKGLMQLLENTAAELAYKNGIKYYPNKTIWDDNTNLLLGVNYISEAHKKEGDYEQTAYCYLGGKAWRKTINKNRKILDCLKTYASSVLEEKEKLDTIYKEMLEKNNYYN